LGVFFLVLVAGSVAGCGAQKVPALPPAFPAAAFDANSPEAWRVAENSKYATYEQELGRYCAGRLPTMDNRDFAMLAGNRAALEEARGDVPACSKAAMDAQAVMNGTVAGEEGKAVAAALANEAAKVFKGECYENAMLNCYVGLANLRLGDTETAGIAFRRALEADKMSKEDCRGHFNLAWWGLAMATIDTERDSAGLALRHCGYKDVQTVAQENLVVLVSLGREPWKSLTGPYGSIDVIMPSEYEPKAVEVFVDGKSLGRGQKLIDLYEQSKGVPRSAKDVGQGAKGVGKLVTAAVVGGFLGSNGQRLVENTWNVCADTRTCYMMPNEVQVCGGHVAPGLHTVQVKFYDAAGQPLPRYEQVWYYVPVGEKGRQYVSVRSEFDRCNVQGPLAFTRVNRVKTDRKAAKTTVRFTAANIPHLAVGDEVKVCHFARQTENRTDVEYGWRYAPMVYDPKGQPMGYPGVVWRMQDFDIGLVGLAKVVSIEKGMAAAEVTSLTTEYVPQEDDMVTRVQLRGRVLCQ
jgi:hypothetical protein